MPRPNFFCEDCQAGFFKEVRLEERAYGVTCPMCNGVHTVKRNTRIFQDYSYGDTAEKDTRPKAGDYRPSPQELLLYYSRPT